VTAFSSATAQSPPNFTGDWGLDQSKSSLPPEMASFKDIAFFVKQDAKEISVVKQMISDMAALRRGESVGVGPLNKLKYKFGGSGGKLQARWSTDNKVLELVATAKDGSTRTEQWQLAPDGQLLTVREIRQDSGGLHEYSLAFFRWTKR
jgi:hypothetical protein